MAILRKLASLTPADDALCQLRKTLRDNARFGITNLQDMADETPAERVLDLVTRMPTPIRVRIMRMPLTIGFAEPSNRAATGGSWPVSPEPFGSVIERR